MQDGEMLTDGSDFNSQPHKEADLMDDVSYRCLYISTHSLTRRLTAIDSMSQIISDISTHSLTRRLTKSAETGA